jgi:mannosyltransferase
MMRATWTSRYLSIGSRKHWVLLTLVLLAATGLRFCRIGAQSFWNDEGNSARLAERSLDLILEGAKGDIHPPGYYLALHFWRALLGQDEAALRALSAVCSVALVGVSFFVGRRLFEDETAGLVAAALVAINPFQVYYAQEARMYAMLALWAMASTWAMLAWWQAAYKGGKARALGLVAYVPLATAGLYTHYAFPFVLLAQNLTTALWLWKTRGQGDSVRRALSWIFAQIAVVLVYLPWLPIAWHQVTSWSSPSESYDLFDALADVWRLLNFGQTIPTEVVIGGLIAAGSLVVLSLFPPPVEDESPTDGLTYHLRWGLPLLLVLVPTVLVLGLGLYKPAYQKFLLVSSAPLSLLVARGTVGGWRLASGSGVWGERQAAVGYRAIILFLAALFLFDTGRSLSDLYFDKTYARADYRAIARRIQEDTRPSDGIILNAPNQWEVFTYYHPDDGHVFPLARQRPFNKAANQAELEQIVADHHRLYAVYWGDAESDPERFIESWLEANTYKAGETWYGDVRLALYAVPAETADTPAITLDAVFVPESASGGTGIHLDGYTVLDEVLAPGDILQMALFWRTEEPISERYKVFVHVYDDAGQLIAQTDSEPGATLRPTSTWSPGERITDHYGVLIPPEAHAGTHTLAVGMYELADPARRLQIKRNGEPIGDRLDLAQVVVQRSEDG